MDRENSVKNVLYTYEEASFIDYNPARVLSLMSDDVIGIGIGGQDTVCSKKSVREILMSAENQLSLKVFAINYSDIEVRFPAENCASVSAKVTLRHPESVKLGSSSFMQSLTLVLTDGAWRICQFHASPIMLSMDDTDASPLLFSKTVVDNLRSQITTEAFDIMSASFVGGVIGVHKVGDKYPLYFANEGVARFLGYSVEEFHQMFQEDASKMIYADDYDYVMKLSEDVLLRNMDAAVRIRLQKKDGSLLPVIDYARRTQDSEGKDILIAVFTDISELVDLHEKMEAQNATILSSIRYASKIQRNLLPSSYRLESAFSEAHALWKPKDIVGGDIYWLKKFEEGAVLAVCDCTGHGTPGALITMLVASVLDNIVTSANCENPALILQMVDKRISSVLNVHTETSRETPELTLIHDGCDLAVLYVAKDGEVTLASAGIHTFVCDGKEVQQIKGQRLGIGNGTLNDTAAIRVTKIPANPANTFYIASDGLFDQIGGEKEQPFGYRPFRDIIRANHEASLAEISKRIWQAFEQHQGLNSRRDDIELVSFRP